MDNENIMDVSASASKTYNFWKENVNRSITDSLKNDDETQTRPYMRYEDVEKAASLKAFHLWKAVEQLCPQASDVAFQLARISGRQATQEHFSCGLLESASKGTITFANRRVPEFLVAEYVAETFLHNNPFRTCPKSRQLHYQLINFILGTCEGTEFHVRNKTFEQKMKRTSQWKLVGVEFSFAEFTFIESMAVGVLNNCMESIPTDIYFPEIPDILNIFTNGAACKILTAAIISNSCGIIRLIPLIIITVINNENKNLIQDSFICKFWSVSGNDIPDELSLSCCAYLCLASKYATVAVVEELENLFKTCLEVDLNQICAEMPLAMKTPLHFAVERHDYKLVKYFAKLVSLTSRNLLLHCVDSTEEYDEEKISIVMSVCQLLIQHSPALVHEECYNESTHKDLLVFLAERGAFSQLTPKEAQYRTFPNMDAPTMRRLFTVPGFDKIKDILLLEAVTNNAMLENVKELLTLEANLFVRDQNNQNLLHRALFHDAMDVARYLVSLGFCLEDRDMLGYTALLRAVTKSEMVHYLISKGADVDVVNLHHENIAHVAIRNDNDGLLTYLLSLEQAHVLFKGKTCVGCTPLLLRLADEENKLKVGTLKKMIALPGFNVEDMTFRENNYFLGAVKGKQDVEILEVLISAGVSATAVNKKGDTALHCAVANGDVDTVKYLLSLGLPLEAMNDNGDTPFLLAKELELIKFLTLNGAAVQVQNINGSTIAHKAALEENIEIISFLLGLEDAPSLFNLKDNKGYTPMQYMLQSSKNIEVELLETLLEQSHRFLQNANPTLCGLLRCYLLLKMDMPNALTNSRRWEIIITVVMEPKLAIIALHMAAKHGDVEKVRYILPHENLESRNDDDGETPLLASFPNGKAAALLIENGADIYATNGKGDTIAHKMTREATYWAKYLIQEKGARDIFGMRNNDGRTPLHTWLGLRELYLTPSTVELILDGYEGDINTEDGNGETAFFTAVKAGRSVELLQVLYKFGANPKTDNERGQNLLHMMSIEGSVRTVAYLVSLGIPLDDPDHAGNTPLLLACKNPDVLKYLASQGANILAADNNRNNIAHKVGYFEVDCNGDVSTLLERRECLELFKRVNSQGRTPLQLAMLSQEDNLNLKKVEMIINLLGVNVNTRDRVGDTLFLSAVRSGKSVGVLKTLLKFGANGKAVNNARQNALHLAVARMTPGDNTVNIFRFLISIGCSTKKKDSQKRTIGDVIDTRKVHRGTLYYDKFCQDVEEMFRLIQSPYLS